MGGDLMELFDIAIARKLGGGGGSTGGGGDIDALLDGSIEEITTNAQKIKSYAFYTNNKLKSINGPLVTEIGNHAFASTDNRTSVLETANFPLLEKLGKSVFDYAINLKSANFPLLNNIGTSGSQFSGCVSLENVNFPLLDKLNSNMFNGCTGLKTAIFRNIVSCSNSVFNNCKLFNTLVLKGDTVVTLSNVNAFSGTPFAIGGTGGTVVCKQHLIEEYKIATNWSTLYEGGTVTFIVLEGSEYE